MSTKGASGLKVRKTVALTGMLAVALLLTACLGQPSPTAPVPAATPAPAATPVVTPEPTPAPTPKPAVTPSAEPTPPPGGALVRLVAEQTEWRAGEAVELRVEVLPGKLGISAGELGLSFDPKVFQVAEAQPGKLLGEDPLIGAQEIDNENGRVVLALARVGPTQAPTGTGDFALVRLKVQPTAPPGSYKLELARMALANEKFQDVATVVLVGLSANISGSQ